MAKVQKVIGMTVRSPPYRRMSTVSFMPCMTEPAPRNMVALKKPWVSRCRMPMAYAAGQADGEKHVADLAHRRRREHLLDVVVGAADDRTNGQGDRTDDRHQQPAVGSEVEDRGGPSDQVCLL